jgi:hypothetical protein
MPELSLTPDYVARLIVKMRGVQGRENTTDPQSGSNAPDDNVIEALRNRGASGLHPAISPAREYAKRSADFLQVSKQNWSGCCGPGVVTPNPKIGRTLSNWRATGAKHQRRTT